MHSPLEEYLHQVETHLQELPAPKRQEEVHEIRLHLESLVTAHTSQGHSEAEAVTQALAQFGKAQTLSKGLAHAFRRRDPRWRGSLLQATGLAFLSGWILSQLRFTLFAAQTPLPVSGSHLIAAQGWGLVTLLLFPLLRGWLTAIIAPRQAVAGVGLAAVLTYALYWITFGFSRPNALSAEMRVRVVVLELVWWLGVTLLAMLGAYMGVQWKKVQLRRVRLA